jgi:uncharacterized membrane protein
MMTYPFNLKIGIRLIILLLGLFLLWKGEMTELWFIIGLVYLIGSITVLFFIARKVAESRKSQENK